MSEALSLSDQAYAVIKQGILDLSFPPGSDLTEARLAAELGMSRAPVRAAMQRLESEGWLEANFRKKTKVKRILRQEVEDIYQLRQLLEPPALREIFAQERTWEYSFLIEAGLLRIKACRDDLYQRERAETDLHMAIIGVFGNQRLTRIYQNVQDELIRIGLGFVRTEERDHRYLDQIINGWEQMVAAIRQQRLEEALDILDRDHLSGALALALKQFDQQ